MHRIKQKNFIKINNAMDKKGKMSLYGNRENYNDLTDKRFYKRIILGIITFNNRILFPGNSVKTCSMRWN